MTTIIVGSRKSRLALKQTDIVIEALKKVDRSFSFEVKEILTKGDRLLDVSLSKIGGKGLFVKEIDYALLSGKIDMAVHSMKDVPAELLEGLVITSIPKRADHRDVLISKADVSFQELPEGASIGTSSLRRAAQLLAARPDVNIQPIRGNIQTRIRKLNEEHLDAIVLAAAGIERMGGLDECFTEFLPETLCLPAVGQGALAIVCREDDGQLRKRLHAIHDRETSLTVTAERAFLRKIGGSCQTPIAAYAKLENEQITLMGLVAQPDGSMILKDTKTGADPVFLGEALAVTLLEKGADQILDKVKEG